MGKALLRVFTVLFLVSAFTHAQTSVQQIEIKSGWGGLGTPQSAHLIIKRNNGEYRLGGKRIDPKLIERLIAALAAPPVPKADPSNLGINPAWCKQNAVTVGENTGAEYREGAPNQKQLFIEAFNDPAVVAQVVKNLFSFTRFDDNPGASVKVTYGDGKTILAKTHSYYVFMLPWQIDGGETYNAQVSRAVASLMPKDTVNKERLAGDDFSKEFGESVMQFIDRDWKLLDARNRAGGALDQIKSKYQIIAAEINPYHNVNYGVEWDSGKPHETNLHVTVRKSTFPKGLSNKVVLRMNGSEPEGVAGFLEGASKYEDLVLSTPLFQEHFRDQPRTPVWISYVHDASFGEKAMRIFAADMHAIGKDNVIPAVRAQQKEIALVSVGGAYWLVFPDKHLLLWRFDGPNGLLRWKPETFPFRECSDYRKVSGGCVGSEISAGGKSVEDFASKDLCAPAPGSPTPSVDEHAVLFPVHKSGKGGYINAQGELVIPFRFDTVGDFSEGLARAECAGRWGFIDTVGRWVIKPQFPWAHDFSDGLARVQVGGEALSYNTRWGFIDKSGTMVVKPTVEELPSSISESDDFHEGLAVVQVKFKKGFIDETGKVVIPPQFSYVYPFSEGLAAVATDEHGDKWGYIDKSGKLVIPANFDWASIFSEGLAPVNRKPPCGFVDQSGAFVLKPPVSEDEKDCAAVWGHFNEGLARWKFGNKYGFIDKTGNVAVEPKYDRTFEFSEGLAAVLVDGKWGYIDKTGRMVIAPRELHSAESFKHGVASVVTKDGKHGYIDKTGKYVWEPARQSDN
jgi:hypothetical protein